VTDSRADTATSPASALLAGCLFWALLAAGIGLFVYGIIYGVDWP
jgi:hypothetical protein